MATPRTARLARRLSAGGLPVYEVLRPKRGVQRKDGKSDPIDAIATARGVLADEATSLPKVRMAGSRRYGT
ncbi:hypothetical protein [Bifidobacterium callitrichos]|uniref:hypothetical protein n=1 Tax=Bifidobacterium callitrichos TaxID=762209 RepID=UPI0021596EA3|nr:hypothetical protein [Bifidobacterium callitrichos]